MYYLNGTPLKLDQPFTDADGNQYPSNWLRSSTQEQRDALGIVWVEPDPAEWYDQRFYWSPTTPKNHTELVNLWLGKVKEAAGTLLAPTDWYITRNSETGEEVPVEVLARRAEIRAFSNEKEAAIVATVTTQELATYVTSAEFTTWETPEEGASVEVTNDLQGV